MTDYPAPVRPDGPNDELLNELTSVQRGDYQAVAAGGMSPAARAEQRGVAAGTIRKNVNDTIAKLNDLLEAQPDDTSAADDSDDAPPDPDAPADLPAYVLRGITKADRSADELRAIAEYADALAERRDWEQRQPLDPDDVAGDSQQVVGSDDPGDDEPGKIYWIAIPCGKESCKKCPHGPYAYRKWRDGEKVRSKYVKPQPERPANVSAD